MKIKAIRRDAGNSGEVVELSAEEKVPLTLKDALAAYPEFEGKCIAWHTDLSTSNVNFYSKGSSAKNKWQNNHYVASGSALIHTRNLSPDKLLAPKKRNFNIEFEDCLDPIGQPDTRVIKFTLE